jgi:hypothetical protein
MKTRRCNKCGFDNPRQYRFCGQCGVKVGRRGLACRLGRHDYAWTRDKTQLCHQRGVCKRDGCDADTLRIRHSFGDFVYVPDSCYQRRECSECHAIEWGNEMHTFGQWAYEHEGSCNLVRVCRRCQAREWRIGEHLFSGWVYEHEGSCDQVRVCRRCHARQRHSGEHIFSGWGYERAGSCDKVRVCVRCYARERRSEEHLFGAWTYEREGSCACLRTCTQCGHRQRGAEVHSFGAWHGILSIGGNLEESECARCHAVERRSRPGAPV